MKSGIYRIICLINGNNYIGSTINFSIRKRGHFNTLKINKHENQRLQNSWNKYGEEYFDFNVIEYCEINLLIEREQYYIDLLKPEFNIRKIAESNLGFKHSEEAKRKMGIAHKGKKFSQERCNKQSKARMGHEVSQETCLKLSIALQGNKNSRRRLSNEDIKEIRTNRKSLRKIAEEYGCDHKVIYKIKAFITYKDI